MQLNLLDGWFKFPVGEGAFYAVFGFVFVFLGITLLILIFTGLGKVMSVVNEKKSRKNAHPPVSQAQTPKGEEMGDDPELIAVITAAVAAYYEGENVPCDFIVRRIKKL